MWRALHRYLFGSICPTALYVIMLVFTLLASPSFFFFFFRPPCFSTHACFLYKIQIAQCHVSIVLPAPYLRYYLSLSHHNCKISHKISNKPFIVQEIEDQINITRRNRTFDHVNFFLFLVPRGTFFSFSHIFISIYRMQLLLTKII